MRLFAIAAILSAVVVSGCDSPFQPASGADVRAVSTSDPVYGGSSQSVVSMHGTVKNVGSAAAFEVTITATVADHSVSQAASPNVLQPGETATWSIKMAGSTRPAISVGWR